MILVVFLFDDVVQVLKGGQVFWLMVQDGVNIWVVYWVFKLNVKGMILMFLGCIEYIEKYGCDVSDFLICGFVIVVIDWCGQGFGQCLLDDFMIGYVGEFVDYQLDVQVVLVYLEIQNLFKLYFLIGYLMGGCIGLCVLYEGLFVVVVVFLVLMWGIQMFFVLWLVVWVLFIISKLLGFFLIYLLG